MSFTERGDRRIAAVTQKLFAPRQHAKLSSSSSMTVSLNEAENTSFFGTNRTPNDVRSLVANGGKADVARKDYFGSD
jgi:hypothetical protein